MSGIWAKQSPDDLFDPTREDITCLIMGGKKTVNNVEQTSKVFFRVMMFSLQTSTLFKVTWGKKKKKASGIHWNFPLLVESLSHVSPILSPCSVHDVAAKPQM